ncbi:MAG TPA: MgtC/SapB family protein, partial [Burkholderiaceae bacterium]|nr:MgtC/SapB family protein [Burkholderiaceae bacterium]
MSLTAFSSSDLVGHLVALGLAYLLSLPTGWDREQRERTAGIRTFPLVAVASCGFALIAIRVLGAESEGQAKVLEGLITGIGFIGGGAILKLGRRTTGTATAASLWTTGALGAAVGYGLYDIAVILAVINFLTLRLLSPLKHE